MRSSLVMGGGAGSMLRFDRNARERERALSTFLRGTKENRAV